MRQNCDIPCTGPAQPGGVWVRSSVADLLPHAPLMTAPSYSMFRVKSTPLVKIIHLDIDFIDIDIVFRAATASTFFDVPGQKIKVRVNKTPSRPCAAGAGRRRRAFMSTLWHHGEQPTSCGGPGEPG